MSGACKSVSNSKKAIEGMGEPPADDAQMTQEPPVALHTDTPAALHAC